MQKKEEWLNRFGNDRRWMRVFSRCCTMSLVISILRNFLMDVVSWPLSFTFTTIEHIRNSRLCRQVVHFSSAEQTMRLIFSMSNDSCNSTTFVAWSILRQVTFSWNQLCTELCIKWEATGLSWKTFEDRSAYVSPYEDNAEPLRNSLAIPYLVFETSSIIQLYPKKNQGLGHTVNDYSVVSP